MGRTALSPVGRPERRPDKQCSFICIYFVFVLFVRVLRACIVVLAHEWRKVFAPFDITCFSACGEFGSVWSFVHVYYI